MSTTPVENAATTGRPREHPQERFGHLVQVVDLVSAGEQIAHEPHAGQHGHRQKAITRHGDSTVALYRFSSAAQLDDHEVNGEVLIHVLQGEVQLRTHEHAATHEYTLGEGCVAHIAAGVRHGLRAAAPSELLVHIHHHE